ncbi:MAG: PilZ domain-containing protein [Deltaproteobacteria bacterium]|nr:PilZ domain-containing protein [Deltaproteobacteria bacterium]
MQLKVCPECYKAFFIPAGRKSVICTHCYFVFSERRSAERVQRLMDMSFTIDGQMVAAKTIDYSDGGAGIIYKGDFLEKGSIVTISFGGKLKLAAKAVWSRKVSRTLSSAGLSLLK